MSVLLGVVVLALIVLIAVEARHYLFSPKGAATTKPTLPAGPAPKPYTIDGTVSRPTVSGQTDAAGTVTIVVYQPAWSSERQQEWEQRVNEKVAAAWRETGGTDAPPKVSADPASVRRADGTIARREQAAKSTTPWKHQCTTEFLALLKENPVEAGRGITAPDGTFSIPVPPPGANPYVIHATGANAQWIDTTRRGSNRLDLNDSNRVPD
jgi:hypothetical protein